MKHINIIGKVETLQDASLTTVHLPTILMEYEQLSRIINIWFSGSWIWSPNDPSSVNDKTYHCVYHWLGFVHISVADIIKA